MGSRLESQSAAVRKRIEKHKFQDEDGEEYEPSKFGGFTDYMRRKKIKLQNLDAELRASAPGSSQIFKGIVVHVNGYTQPSLQDLHVFIVTHGGGFVQYLDGKTMVTHIIASNLTPKKKVEFSRYRIVKPAWIVDSVAAGKALPWDSYRLLDEGIKQKVLGFEQGSIVSQSNKHVDGYRNQTDTSWYTDQVKGIARDLDLSNQLHRSGLATQQAYDPEAALLGSSSLSGHPSANDKEQTRFSQSAPDQSSSGGETRVQQRNSHTDDDVIRMGTDEDADSRNVASVQKALVNNESVLSRFSSPITEDGSRTDDEDAPDESISNVAAVATENSDATPFASEPSEHVPRTVAEDLGWPDWANDNAGSKEIDAKDVQHMTPEEHNALLLADPKVRKSTGVNPGFLKQYYEESRLHHLSTWKAALKSQLQALANEKTASQKSRQRRPPGSRRYILHVDFDSFFAAVSLRKAPHYVEKPVVIAHGKGSGAEIASSNYPARKFGIKNGMWMKHAQKLCPELKVLPYDFKAYEEASRSFYDAVIGTGGLVQSVSVDEALVDVSLLCIAAGGHEGKGVQEGSIWREQAEADEIAQSIRNEVLKTTGCAVSVGIGGNILLAKVALRKAKPAGQYHLKPEAVLDFLGGLQMQDLPGVAYSIGGKLEDIGVKFVKDVRELSKERMTSILGPKTGEKIWDYARGIDRTEVGEQVVRKSVSAEVNWGIRFVTQHQVDDFFEALAEELHQRLLTESVKGRQLTIKIMRRAADAPLDPPKHLGHGKCDTFNKSIILGVATNDAKIIAREALSVLKGYGFSPGELRGIGFQVQKLESLKAISKGTIDSSQKKLHFRDPRPTVPVEQEAQAQEIDSREKPGASHASHDGLKNSAPSTKKVKAQLNTLGTQFVLPSQIDPAVLDELPQDIRSRLLAQSAQGVNNDQDEHTHATETAPSLGHGDAKVERESRERSGTPASNSEKVLPLSQLDQNALDALPQDLRDEVLAGYHTAASKSRTQALLPQSPRKDRLIKLPKKLTTPTKRRGRPLGGGGYKAAALAHSTLTQSNFVAHAKTALTKDAIDSFSDGYATGEISEEFLSALPEDIRDEVVAQARRERLQKKSGLDIQSKRKRAGGNKDLPKGQRTLVLPQRPPKPTFTAREYSSLSELREAITAWYEEFANEDPDQEDVEALVKYLQLVVGDEGDMDKAVNAARWLRWIIDSDDRNMRAWRSAVDEVEAGIQNAVQARGLGSVDFGV